MNSRPTPISDLFARIQKYSDRVWYFPLVYFLAALDLFVGVIPTDALVVGSVLFKPRRWWRIALNFVIASTLASVVLAQVSMWLGDAVIHDWVVTAGFEQTWVDSEAFLNRWGTWGLFLAAVGPFPLQPAVILCGLSHMPWVELVVSVGAGRVMKYVIFAYVAANAPHLLSKLRVKTFDSNASNPSSQRHSPTKTSE